MGLMAEEPELAKLIMENQDAFEGLVWTAGAEELHSPNGSSPTGEPKKQLEQQQQPQSQPFSPQLEQQPFSQQAQVQAQAKAKPDSDLVARGIMGDFITSDDRTQNLSPGGCQRGRAGTPPIAPPPRPAGRAWTPRKRPGQAAAPPPRKRRRWRRSTRRGGRPRPAQPGALAGRGAWLGEPPTQLQLRALRAQASCAAKDGWPRADGTSRGADSGAEAAVSDAEAGPGPARAAAAQHRSPRRRLESGRSSRWCSAGSGCVVIAFTAQPGVVA